MLKTEVLFNPGVAVDMSASSLGRAEVLVKSKK
jgi:hypothetical protein